MNNLIEEFINTQGSDVASNISSKLGLDTTQITKMLPDIAPSLLDGIKNNLTNNSSGVAGILKSFDGGDVTESITGLMGGNSEDEESSSLVNTILGGSKSNIISSLASKFNMGGETVTKIVSMVIPLLMKFLSDKSGESGLSGLTSLLGSSNIMDGMLGDKSKDLGSTLKNLF